MRDDFQVIVDGSDPFGSTDKHLSFLLKINEVSRPIGTVSSSHREGLLAAFHLPPELHGKGIGFTAFKIAVDHFSALFEVRFIIGTWRVDSEYAYLPGYRSTNLTIYRQGIDEGISQQQAALRTPTGKWAMKLGFQYVELVRDSEDDVEVRFHKFNPAMTLAEPEQPELHLL